jgi:small subunit ribosomal protein S8
MTDPIADMVSRIRNGIHLRKGHVDIPASRIKAQIAKILLDQGYVTNVKYIESDVQGSLRIYLKYGERKASAITGFRRSSKVSRRLYVSKDQIPRVMGGYGTAIISTSKGILTDKECRALGIGGEVLCQVW